MFTLIELRLGPLIAYQDHHTFVARSRSLPCPACQPRDPVTGLLPPLEPAAGPEPEASIVRHSGTLSRMLNARGVSFWNDFHQKNKSTNDTHAFEYTLVL